MIPTLADALAARGYENLTAVQKAVLDPEVDGRDLLVSAQTGSGKTVGFGLAIAPQIVNDDGRVGPAGLPLAVIVAPTRELALQVQRELTWLYGQTGAVIGSAVGGMDPRDERRKLDRGVHIVVGTPGRLRDHTQRGALDMSEVKAIVLDEADEMLDLGFREDLEYLLGEAPEERRTLLFSATVPAGIAKLAKSYQRDAMRLQTAGEARQHTDITYQMMNVGPRDAENAIINTLLFHDAENAIVFANTRAVVARLTARLSNRGFQVVSLSGELSQAERTHALQAMRDGRARVCVATDVAARGIDLPGLELVIHAELPSNSETLLHRSGRTGRAGKKGISALIVPPKAKGKATRLLKGAKVEAEWTEAPSAEEVQSREEERLLNDESWNETPTDTQAAFAERLLERYSAETIAAAYLRLYQARRSAPEDLGAPSPRDDDRDQAKAKRREEFGPAVWFSLSIGREGRADPRWMLPMLAKSGGISKDEIGAIRIQDDVTYVEIAEKSADGFATMTADGLEQGITAERMASAPDFSFRGGPKGGGKKSFDRGDRKPRENRGDWKPREDRGDFKPREDRKPKGDWKPREDRGDFKPREDRKPKGDWKPREDKPKGDWKPRDNDKPKGDWKPREDRKPKGDFKDRKPKGDWKPREDRAGKPAAKSDGEGKKRWNGDDKRRRNAMDTSKRMDRGADARPQRKGPPAGGKPKRGK